MNPLRNLRLFVEIILKKYRMPQSIPIGTDKMAVEKSIGLIVKSENEKMNISK